VLPLEGLHLRLGGAADRLLFFSHPQHPEVSVYSSDHTILEHTRISGNPAFADQLLAVRNKKNHGKVMTAAGLAALVLIVLALVALKDPLVGLVASQVPPQAEVKIGDTLFGQIQSTMALLQDKELQSQLDELVSPLFDVIPETGYPFQFHLANDGTLNAFAVPGGHVVVHSGLVLEAESAEEVLGVLAHEIAHITQRHSLRQMISAAGVFVLVQTLFGDLSGIAALMADGGLQLLTLEFSRGHERDADSTGFEYLVEAGINPVGMISFFEKLQAQAEEAEGIELPESLVILSTHPTSRERIERLDALFNELDNDQFRPLRFDFLAFQDRVRQATTDSEP
jgi:predicted Zn-dependent protease